MAAAVFVLHVSASSRLLVLSSRRFDRSLESETYYRLFLLPRRSTQPRDELIDF